MLRKTLQAFLSEARLYLNNRVVAFVPSHHFRRVFYKSIMGMRIGEGSTIAMGAWMDCAEGLQIGTNSIVNHNCRLDARGTIRIGNNVNVSADVCILTADHDIQSSDFRGRHAPVVLEDLVFIGTRALILPGVKIGEGGVVAAGSVVTKSVKPYSVVAGVPAREINSRTRNLSYSGKYIRLFH